MLKLDLNPKPIWLDLVGAARVELLPARTSLMQAARDDLRSMGAEEDGQAADQEDGQTDAKKDGKVEFGMLDLGKAVAKRAIISWEGVCDASGEEVAPSPEWIDALLEDERAWQAFLAGYLLPAMAVVEEGNA